LRDAGMESLPEKFLDAIELPGDRFISRSGYTGEDGFEIALPASEAEAFARKLLSDERVMMIGLGARDSLRLEAGLPLYGQDLGEDISPMEAGLAWAIPASNRAGGSFVGADALARKFAQGRTRKRIAIVPEGTAPVRAHASVLDAEGNTVGEITSGGFGPSLNHPIALALVSADAGDTLFADLRGRRVALTQVKLPFVPHRYKN
jgi:aminomethyltransferase